MGKTWTRIKRDRTFEFGRAVLVQGLLVSVFVFTAVAIVITVMVKVRDEPIVLVLITALYLMLVRAVDAYQKIRSVLSEWKRWREFLKELENTRPFDDVFVSHDL